MQTNPPRRPKRCPKRSACRASIHSIDGPGHRARRGREMGHDKALAARSFAAPALPALKPNQPTHNIAAPSAV